MVVVLFIIPAQKADELYSEKLAAILQDAEAAKALWKLVGIPQANGKFALSSWTIPYRLASDLHDDEALFDKWFDESVAAQATKQGKDPQRVLDTARERIRNQWGVSAAELYAVFHNSTNAKERFLDDATEYRLLIEARAKLRDKNGEPYWSVVVAHLETRDRASIAKSSEKTREALSSQRESGPVMATARRVELWKDFRVRKLLHPAATGGGELGHRFTSTNAFRADQLAEPYISQHVFRQQLIRAIELDDQAQGSRTVAEQKYEQREKEALEEYGLDLHRLFQVLCETNDSARSDAFLSSRQVKDSLPIARESADIRPDLRARFEHLIAPPSEYDLEHLDPHISKRRESYAIGSLKLVPRDEKNEDAEGKARSNTATKKNQPPKKR
jgi:hypothetical protein